MNLYRAVGSIEQAAELSQDPDLQRVAHAIAEAFKALANDLNSQSQQVRSIESSISHLQAAVNRLR